LEFSGLGIVSDFELRISSFLSGEPLSLPLAITAFCCTAVRAKPIERKR